MEADDFELDDGFNFGGFHKKSFDVMKRTRWSKRRHSDVCKYIYLACLPTKMSLHVIFQYIKFYVCLTTNR